MGQAEKILDLNFGELELSVLVSVYKKDEYVFVYVLTMYWVCVCVYRCVYRAER